MNLAGGVGIGWCARAARGDARGDRRRSSSARGAGGGREGVRVEEEAVLGRTVVLTGSTQIRRHRPEEIIYKGRVPGPLRSRRGTRTKEFPAGEYQRQSAS